MAHRYLVGQEVMYALSVGQLKAILANKDDTLPVIACLMAGAEALAPLKMTNTTDVYFAGPNVLAWVSGGGVLPGEPIQEALVIWVGAPNYNPPYTSADAYTGAVVEQYPPIAPCTEPTAD